MIQLGQLSLFVMAQLASRLPFQSVHVSPRWTYQLNSFLKKKKKEKTQRGKRNWWRKIRGSRGEKWNKECSNNHIIHLNAEANYRDKCDCFVAEMLFMEMWSEGQEKHGRKMNIP